jgi:hypothetical protein
MYSKQLLIKMDQDMLQGLKEMSEEFGVKISTFARMILKNYLEWKKKALTEEDKEDIKKLRKAMRQKTTWHDWKDVKKELFE